MEMALVWDRYPFQPVRLNLCPRKAIPFGDVLWDKRVFGFYIRGSTRSYTPQKRGLLSVSIEVHNWLQSIRRGNGETDKRFKRSLSQGIVRGFCVSWYGGVEMRTFTRGLIGLFSIVFLLGVLPLESEAGKWKKYFDNHVSHKDLRADHEDLEYDNRKTHEWLEKIEGMLAPVKPVCPVAGGTPDASGQYVTYEADALDPKKVCDIRTGLFYEHSPSTSTFQWSSDGTATEAQDHCTNDLGAGWRLPTSYELYAVVDVTTFQPAVNTSVFSNVQSAFYWSALTHAAPVTQAWGVHFTFGNVNSNPKSNHVFVWCVRNGS